MNSPTTRGEKTRIQIVESAYQLFLEQGYHGTSMRQIAAQAGIALGGIYNHFAGKQEIFEAVFTAKHPYLKIADVLPKIQADTIEQAIIQLTEAVWNMTNDRESVFNLVFIEIVEFKSAHIAQLFEALFPVFIQFTQRLRELPPGLKPVQDAVLARTLIGMLMSMQVTEIIMGAHFDESATQEYIHQTVKIFLNGILAETTRA